MISDRPRVSIGLPVHNGENYLSDALDSILAQTFENFELIISDNASNDGTEQICREYAAKDPRISYYRNDENLGMARNFNRVFELSHGEYFKWAAHDDVCAPDFLSKCVEVLDRDPSVVLCHTKTGRIDSDGRFLRNYEVTLQTDSPKPQLRFYYLICVNHPCFQIFGVIRSSVLRMTPLFGNYKNMDRVLLARLGLLGRFHEMPEYLFLNRFHPEQSVRFCHKPYQYYVLIDPANEGRLAIFPEWRLFYEYCMSVLRAPLGWDARMRCFLDIGRWLRGRWRKMVGDLIDTGKRIVLKTRLFKSLRLPRRS